MKNDFNIEKMRDKSSPIGSKKPQQNQKLGLMEKLVKWLDPKLDKFRIKPEVEESPEPIVPEEPEMPELYLPETTEDLVWLLRKMPESVLRKEDKERIATAMSFDTRQVRDIMTERDAMTFVHENDFLGPLMLDQLYKSGLSHFPVLGAKGEVVGVIHTDALNKLEIKETDRASKHLDKNLTYLRADYTLEQAFAAVLRTNSYFFIVINQLGMTVGVLSFEKMIEALIGKTPEDEFRSDDNKDAVAHR